MPRRNPIVGWSIKKRLIHLNLMVKEDARKAIGSNRILEIKTKLSNPSGDIRRRIFFHWETLKKCSLGWKYVGKGFRLKQLLLYLSKLARVLLIHSLRMQNQPCVCKVKAAYVGLSPRMLGSWQKFMFLYFEQGFSYSHAFLEFLWPTESFRTHSKHQRSKVV